MNFLLETLRLGLKNLRLHLLRSVLTSLGIILGVGAVIIMVSIGEGNKQAALREIQSLGATNIIVRSTRPPESASFGTQERSMLASYGLLYTDLVRLEEFLDDAAHIVPLKSIGSEVSVGSNRMLSQCFGTLPELLGVANLRIDRGRYITREDLEIRAPVAVIGAELSRQMFPLADPLGQTLRIDEQLVRIVGILKPVGLAGGTGSALVGRDLNKDVHIPLTTAQMQFGDELARRQSGTFSFEKIELWEIFVTAQTTEGVLGLAERVRRLVAVGPTGPSIDRNDVEVIVPWELLENAKRTALVWNIVLISIAAISLIVGGIGIMNIMLASVTERTREIGIRRALGATRRHITAQFLVETGSLSAVGGLLGIGLGVAVSVGIERFLPWLLSLPAIRQYFETKVTLETQITPWSIIASFIVAAAVGLVFGIYPAIVASRQDPIVALRHD
ncbi:MAG: ABC transporter permease [Planctomycetota bacterium]|jgi:putative ABC transport system permease protein